jgi:acetyl-CoA acetyltransferase family protein
MGQDPYGPSVRRRYAPGLVAQGISAELVAAKWSLDREALDAYAARSHQRAAAAAESGEFAAEIAPIQVPDRAGHVDADETIRPNTTPEGLSGLKAAFYDAELALRFPEIGWHITAGNSSQLTDGASAVLIVSEARAVQLGLPGRARVHASYVCGDDPVMMLTGPIPATNAVLERGRVRLQDLDHVEINEAFASVPLAWLSEFPIEEDRLNPVGGAIALGHPLGASGARLFTTMLHALERTGGRWGLQAMCEAGGMANATLVERL